MRIRFLPLAYPLLMLAACHSAPDDVVKPSEMASLLADMDVAKAYYQVEGMPGAMAGMEENDSMCRVLRQSILMEHGVGEDAWQKSLDWYGHHLDLYEEVGEMRIKEIEKRQRESATLTSADISETGLFPVPSMPSALSLAGHTGRREFVFSLPASSLKKGDRLEWKFSTTSLSQPLEVIIGAEYGDTLLSLTSRHLMSEGAQAIPLQIDSTRKPSRIFGRIRPSQYSLLLLDSLRVEVTPLSAIRNTRYYDIMRQNVYRTPKPTTEK